MTASLTAPNLHESQTLIAPLMRLAPFARGLMFAGLLIAACAVFANAYGFSAWAVPIGVMGGALALMSSVSAFVSRQRNNELRCDSNSVSQFLADDPEPVIISDYHGVPCAANSAAGTAPDLVARLSDWCVDPVQSLAALLSEVQKVGQSDRNYIGKYKTLRVQAHRSGGSGQAIVWRFSYQDRRALRGVDVLGLPILTLAEDAVTFNTAAQDLGDAERLGELARSIAHCAPPDGGGIAVTLPSGQAAQAHIVTARDGVRDVVFLPPQTHPQTTTPTHLIDYEEIPVALVQLDPGGRIIGTNRLARALLTLDAEESRFFWQVVEGLGRPVADWLEDARAGRALGRPEVLRAMLTGTEAYVQIILRRVGGLGSDAGLVAVISDATELKSLEARFVQSQKMQAIGQLAGGVAHDFNNLLTAISGHCDLLLINRDRYDPDYNDLLQIHQNANRAAALVRQLLAFSRKQTMKPEVLRIESLLEELTHLLTRLVGERISVTLTHDPALTAIRADRRQLEQVIMNLVVNARDAMPMGGTIRIESEAQHFDTEQEYGRARIPPGDYALVRVIDEGIGIPAALIDKIFEPFFTTKKLGEGTGLGLSTAYGIVKQMGGYIFAKSVEGSGTTFTLFFASLSSDTKISAPKPSHRMPPPHPTARLGQAEGDGAPSRPAPSEMPSPKSAVAQSRTATPHNPLSGGTILLVEDEAPVRAFAARALRLQGYQVFEAQDGEQALDFLQDPSLSIDLFVTDVIMPGIDGPGWVAQALRHRPGTPVVFVSGYTEDSVSEALSRIPRSVFLGKPFSLHDLSEAIGAQLTE